jgi:hypothetical protein
MWEPAAAISAPSPTAPELIDERLACCVLEPDPDGDPGCGAEFDQCRLIDQLLNRLGNAMAINRLIIAEGKDSTAVAAASDALAAQNESYRRTKRQRANAPKPAAMAGSGTEGLLSD